MVRICLLLFFLLLCRVTCSSATHLCSSAENSAVTCSSTTHLCSSDENSALLQFKKMFTIDSDASSSCFDCYDDIVPKIDSWKDGTDCCTWDGVTCDKMSGHVIRLDLSCSWILGAFHSNNTLFLLRHLQRLNLAYNDFKNTRIPSQFGSLTGLTHLNLSSSSFSGQFPSELSHLSKLVSLDLSYNFGKIKNHDFERIAQNLTDLRQLRMDSILMNLVEPHSLKNLSSSLKSLRLSNCSLYGKLPNSIFHLPNLQVLDLSANEELNHYFPKDEWNSPLRYLNLRRQYTVSLGKQHRLPNSLGNLTQLTFLDLSFNKFSGEIPFPLSNLVKLEYLQLTHNYLSGQIPSWITNLTQLVFIDLSYNKLAGSIPSDITWPPNLTQLILNDNKLNGTIPSSFYNLSSLVTLDLYSNKLTGRINEFQYQTLEYINLNNNELQGPIPRTIFEQVNLLLLDLSLNNLSGKTDFEMFSKLKHLTLLDLSYNNLSLTTNNQINLTFPMLDTLALASCNLSKFPSFLPSSLEKLSILDLSDNQIDGLIPKWVLNLGKIESDTLKTLNLSHNLLEGFDQYPGIVSWPSIQYLDLQSNLLQGSLPIPSHSTDFFSVANNKLSGVIPPSFCNMSNVEILDLSNNNLSGSIPLCLGNLSSTTVLNLGKNRFHGLIPQTFQPKSALQALDFSENQLQGSIPRSLAHCKRLEVLNLGNNNLVDTFPFWLDKLPKLHVLVLRSNKFYGPIMQRKSTFSELNIIDLSHNNFTGNMSSHFFERLKSMAIISASMPKRAYMSSYGGEYFNSVDIINKGLEMKIVRILTIFKAVDFSNNHLEGEIPKSVGNLKSLHGLNFSGNGLTGPIPSSFGNLTGLESLDLSKNKLSGEIPGQLANLTFLSVFDVSQNHLVGTIPQGRQFETFSNTSHEKNSGLCGPPLSKKCKNTEEAPPLPSSFKENQSSYKFGRNVYDWILVVMGYGCGLVIGLAGGNFIFEKKKKWFMNALGVCRVGEGRE